LFKKIDHVEIVTDHLDRAVQFYTDVLGFKLRARERIDRSSLGVSLDLAYLDLGATAIELIAYGGPVAPAPTQEHLGYRMMALEVADMQSAIDYLKTKNVPVTWGRGCARASTREPRSAIPTGTASSSGTGSTGNDP
jgi:glyoxylase I family protein